MPTEQSTTLIPIITYRIGTENMQSVDGRVLHEQLGSGQQYADWIRRWIKRANLLEHRDYEIFHNQGKNSHVGRPAIEYVLSLDAAKCIAMMSGGEKGDQVRQYFLECERIVLAQTQKPLAKDPTIQLMIDAVLRIDALQAEQDAQREALIRQQATVIETQAKALEGYQLAQRADGKADLALEDSAYLTIEEFVILNGLLRQVPEPTWKHVSAWLKKFCQQWALRIEQRPTPDRPWPHENAYHVRAFAAWQRWELRRPRQIVLEVDEDYRKPGDHDDA